MDRARRRTEKLLSTLLLEECGMRNVPALLFNLATLVCCVAKQWRSQENLEHIVHHCPHWNKESGLPSHAQEAPACVQLHGLLPAPPPGALPAHEPPLHGHEGWSAHCLVRRIRQTQQQPTLQKMWGWLRH
eukprot:4051360-Amphidinium_carterae.3